MLNLPGWTFSLGAAEDLAPIRELLDQGALPSVDTTDMLV